MPEAAATYRHVFDRFGYPLARSHSLPAESLARAETRLAVRAPLALRDYYRVAGKERRFNTAHNRLLQPREWFVAGNRLAFLEENQAVSWWGVPVKREAARDPSVYQGIDHEDMVWAREHRRCSTFLVVVLHYQAVSGGFPYCGSAPAPDNLHERLRDGWKYVGEVNRLWAFNRQDQAVCVMPGGAAPFSPAMVLLAGAKTRSALRSVEEALAVTLK
jgi:hypothetical protein